MKRRQFCDDLNFIFDAVKRSFLHKFPETTKVGFKSGLLAYEEKNQPADPTTNPTQLKVVYGVVTMSDVLNGVVPVKDGFSFARNLVIQLHTKLNLARATEIRRLEGTGKSVYNPRWRDTNKSAYEQTIVFGVDEIRINGHYQHQSIYTAIHEDLGDTRVERWMVRKRVCQPHQDLARVQ